MLLAERGLFPSRTAAAQAIRAGHVKLGIDGPVALRPSQEVPPDQAIEVVGARPVRVARRDQAGKRA